MASDQLLLSALGCSHTHNILIRVTQCMTALTELLPTQLRKEVMDHERQEGEDHQQSWM